MSDLKQKNDIIYLGPPEKIKKKKSRKHITETNIILSSENISNPIWLSVSEAAKISGVNQKTIRRAIQAKQINYKIQKDRYLLNLNAVIQYMCSNTKLKNKFNQYGLGQYIK